MTAIDLFITKFNRVNWHGLMSRFVNCCGLCWQDITDKHGLPDYDNSYGFNEADELTKIDFNRWEDVLQEIEMAVQLRKDDIEDIRHYVVNILSQLKYVSSFFFQDSDFENSFLQKLTSYIFNDFPYQKVLPTFIREHLINKINRMYSVWHLMGYDKVETDSQNAKDTEDVKKEKNKEYQKLASQFFSSINKIRQDDSYHVLHQIVSDLKQLAIYIESVLIDNGISSDLLNIQDESKIHITDVITIEDIAILRHWPIEKTRALAKGSNISDKKAKKNSESGIQGKDGEPEHDSVDFPLDMLRAKKYTPFSINFVDTCGEYEIDRLFFQIIKRQEGYTDTMFLNNCGTFKEKCIKKATSNEDEDEKEAWIVSVLNVLSEVYYHSFKKDKVIFSRTISFWAIIEGAFLKSVHQICVKRIAMDLEISNILDYVDEEKDEYEVSFRDPDVAPMTLTEQALFCELGSSMLYQERRICKGCTKNNCKYRFGRIRYFADVNYDYDYDSLVEDKKEESESKTVEDTIHRLASTDTIAYLESLLALFGVTPYNTARRTDSFQEKWDDFINKNHPDFSYETFANWEDVAKEIRQNIKKRANVEHELEGYIFSLLSPLEDTCAILFSEEDDYHRVYGAHMLHLFLEIDRYSPDEFKALWRDSEKKIKAGDDYKGMSVIKFISSVEEQARDAFYEEKQSRNSKHRNALYVDKDASILFHIVDDLRILACIIEGALLENGIQNDIYYYQNASGVTLADDVDSVGVSSFMNWTTKQAETLIKKYHHLVIRDGDTVGSKQSRIEIPVSVSFGDISILPEEFRTKRAASIWEKAYAAQIIDEKFQFKGSRTELALFASFLSNALFGKIDWQTIKKWYAYEYYTQKYNLISSKQPGDLKERELVIYKLFN